MRYPIVAMAMNQISDINLAIAVRKAGGLPSLSVFNYAKKIEIIKNDIISYRKEFNDAKLLFSLGIPQLLNQNIVDIILTYKIEFIELIPDDKKEILLHRDIIDHVEPTLQLLKNNGVKIFEKCITKNTVYKNIDGVILKSKDGGGRGELSLEDLFNNHIGKYPIIVSGGIGTAEQVKHYISSGAIAVGIGTLLAASKESKLSEQTKLKMVEANSEDIRQFSKGVKQNALIFNEVEDDDYNHTLGIKSEVQNPGTGHVFAGKAIDHVNSIQSVSEIINNLTFLL
jgi:NAD(P)H-dependent flavin oxidoreductase YrpB (nitropropane dioxygenase family)